MKKSRKILSAVTAVAVAFMGFIVPTTQNIETGFNINASAAKSASGLWLSQPMGDLTPGLTPAEIAINNATIAATAALTDDDDEVKIYPYSLEPGDIVQLNITLPDLANDVGAFQLKIKYDDTIAECVQWYQTGWERLNNNYVDPVSGSVRQIYTDEELDMIETWPAAGTYTGNNHGTGEANFRRTPQLDESCLTLVSPEIIAGGNVVPIEAFNGQSVTLIAKFKVLEDIDDITALGFEITEHEFLKADDTQGTGLGEDLWDPADTTAEGTIAAVIRGKLTKIEIPEEAADRPRITITSPTTINWYVVGGAAAPDPVIVDADGSFEFKGLTPGLTYKLTVDQWVYDDTFKINATDWNGMDTDLGDWELWLYGDIDHDGVIGALDATQVLRYVVGKNCEFYRAEDDEALAKLLKIANVNEDHDPNDDTIDIVNVIDATQILRKAGGKASSFDGHPAP